MIEIVPEPDGRDHLGREPIYRLKRFLKTALRAYGLRATSRTEAPDDTETRLREAGGDVEPEKRLVGKAAERFRQLCELVRLDDSEISAAIDRYFAGQREN